MRVWLLHIGEELPVDGATRVYRYGYLAQALQDAGHEVLRWAPTFSHVTKSHRYQTDCRVAIAKNYTIQFVHSPGYRHNIGLERLRTCWVLGKRFQVLAHQESPPDVIVAAIPSLEWADAAVSYGRACGTPVVVDVRDPWPDVYLNAVPAPVRPIGRFFLSPYYKMARSACQRATALTAVSQSYLQWALKMACRNSASCDRVVPIGFEPEVLAPATLQKHVSGLIRRGINPNNNICLYAGQFENSYDVETIVKAARLLEMSGRNDVQFVLCGKGSNMPALKRRAQGLKSVHFLGWVDAAIVQAVASVSTIGLCAYSHRALQSLPNKPFEYMAGRLAVVSSLNGELSEQLELHQCGVTYPAGDAESLKQCILQLVDNPARLQKLRSNGFEAWKKHFRSSHIYSGFVDHLTKLTTKTAQAA